jgi:serine-type D-Ala-D-Ala carboxypeptidase/endopeptidase (penicillin-binding protein 4)
MNRRICIVFFFLLWSGSLFSQSAGEIAKYWEDLIGQPEFQHAQAGIQITETETGKIIFEHNSDKLFIPASVLKLVTSASALEMLGPDYCFHTRLGYSGSIVDSILRGDLVIIGGGDAALGSEHFRDHYFSPHFLEKWARQIGETGIRRVEGNLVLDATWFDTENIPPTWIWEDIGNYFGAGASALTVYDNLFRIRFSSPASAGKPTEIISVYPEVEGLKFRNEVLSSDDNRDLAWVFGTPFDGFRVIRGTIPENRKIFTIRASNPFPEELLAADFLAHLYREGISVSGETVFSKTDPDAFKQVCFTKSPPLSEFLKVMHYKSVNLYAEHLVKQIAAEMEGAGSRESGLKLISGFWKKKGLDTQQLVMADGSGLSHFNAVTPSFLCALLNFMSKNSSHSSLFYESLPRAGEGTLTLLTPRHFSGSALRAKSGSMKRIRSYAGYMTFGSEKKYTFALMVNHFSGEHQKLISSLEKILFDPDYKN